MYKLTDRHYKLIGLALIIGSCLVTTSFLGYFVTAKLVNKLQPSNTISVTEGAKVIKPTIKAKTLIREERVYACGHLEVNTHVIDSKYVGKDFSEFITLYPPEEGWTIDDTVPKLIIVAREEWDYCVKHQGYRHLALRDGKLVIFQGPLGIDRTLLQKENYSVDDLPEELVKALKLSQTLDKITREQFNELRKCLEFPCDEDLNVFLDGLE